MKKLSTLLLALLATTALWAENVITYTATEKLPEVTKYLDSGLHTNAFNVAITSHEFADGVGAITFVGEVTSIGDYAFYYCTSLSSITIPNSVTRIGYAAFLNCTSLSSVTIPNSVTSIEDWAFAECSSLSSITIPNSVTNIGEEAFYYCSSLSSVTIGDSVTRIGNDAFHYCTSLSSVTIPNSVTSIGYEAFASCTSLSSITVDAANTHYVSVDGVLFNYAKDTLIQYPIGNTRTTYTIPNRVTSIGDYAFLNCTSLSSVTIPNSVTSIEDWAFADCTSLSSITIPNSVTNIGEEAFYYCPSLTSITCYATTPPTCGGWCFSDVDKSIPIYVPAGSVSAYKAADEWKDFTNIQSIRQGQCGDNLYWQYEKGTLTITGSGAMYNEMPWVGFADSITQVNLPTKLTTIGEGSFQNLIKLNSIVIPASVTYIGANAFEGCRKLFYVYCYATEPPYAQTSSFENYNVYLRVPCDNLIDYQLDVVFGSFKYIECIGAEETTTTEVIVTPSDNTATITWPTTTGADSYTIVIYKGGVTFCTLTFNAQGQLTNIAFAPGRGANNAAAATAVAGGYKFTITSLDSGTNYTYTIDTKNAVGTTIANYTGKFTTTSTPTDIRNVSENVNENVDVNANRKVMKDGQVVIIKDGRSYNVGGAEVR